MSKLLAIGKWVTILKRYGDGWTAFDISVGERITYAHISKITKELESMGAITKKKVGRKNRIMVVDDDLLFACRKIIKFKEDVDRTQKRNISAADAKPKQKI